MSHRVFALVIENELHPMDSLREALREILVDTSSVNTCEEARRLLTQTEPHLIFTAMSVSDGSWMDVIVLAEKVGVPSNVVVVSQTTDVKLFLSTMEGGAFDFIVPPFEPGPLAHIVRSAWLDAQRRRQGLLRLVVV